MNLLDLTFPKEIPLTYVERFELFKKHMTKKQKEMLWHHSLEDVFEMETNLLKDLK